MAARGGNCSGGGIYRAGRNPCGSAACMLQRIGFSDAINGLDFLYQ